MNFKLRRHLKGDKTIWVVFLLLCLVSAVEMFSASSELAFKHSSYTAPVLRHVVFLIMGSLIVFVVHLLPLRYVRMGSYILLLISIITLILVLSMGIQANEAARWLAVGGFQFQPSELAKLSLIIVTADFIARIKDSKTNEDRYFSILMGISVLVCGLIFKENLSTAILLFGVIWLMMFIGKISWKKLSLVVASLVVLLIMGYGAGKILISKHENNTGVMVTAENARDLGRLPTWVARIDRFLEKKDETEKYIINDENFQIQHSKIAIALGGLTGKMPGNSKQRDFIPQAYSDFIFAIIIEELGLFGGVIIMLLYLTLLFRAGVIARKSETVFPAILMIGLSLMIVLQAFVNMAVASGLGPVTGQPLPMISRGGTSILITSIYFGILLSITHHIKEGSEEEIEEILILDDEDYEPTE